MVQKYESCWDLLVPTSPLCLYVSSLFINNSELTKSSYCTARADHCAIVIMTFLQFFAVG